MKIKDLLQKIKRKAEIIYIELESLVRGIYLILEQPFCSLMNKKYILFIIRNEIMFMYAQSIYERLSKDERLKIWFCFHEPYRFLPGNFQKIKRKYHFNFVPFKLARFLKWRLILFPNHMPGFRKDCKKVYIGHGLLAGKKVKNESYVYGSRSLDKNSNIIYDKIFISSEFEKGGVKQHFPKFYSRVKVVGSILADEMNKYMTLRNKILKDINIDTTRKTIMLSSTWGRLSFLQSYGSEFLKHLPDISQKYNVIITVHLNNFVKEYSRGIDWRDILSRISYKNVFIIFNGESPYPFLICADLLITDMTSLGLYYPQLLRPMVFLDNEKAEYDPNSLIPELRKTAYVIKDVSNIKSDIEKAFEAFNPEKMLQLHKKIISYPGEALRRYSEEIYELLSLKSRT